MATVTKTVLKTYFEQGDIPTQGQYVDLIDSQFGLGESGTQIIEGTISASSAEIEYITLKQLYLPGNGIASMKIGTTFTVGKTLEVKGDINATGNISASGNLYADKYHSNGYNLLRYKPNQDKTIVGSKFTTTTITGSSLILGDAPGLHVTASGHISGSATSTGSFGRVEVATRLEHAQDENTAISFTSDNVVIKANNIQGAKFGSTGGVQIGNTTYATNITGSTISLSGNLTASNAVFTSTVRTQTTISASLGVNATDGAVNTNVVWSNTGTQVTARRSFTLTFSSLPAISNKYTFQNEYMIVSNPQITTTSVIIVNQAASHVSAEHIQLMVYDVRAGYFAIKPYGSDGAGLSIPFGGAATYNFVIL